MKSISPEELLNRVLNGTEGGVFENGTILPPTLLNEWADFPRWFFYAPIFRNLGISTNGWFKGTPLIRTVEFLRKNSQEVLSDISSLEKIISQIDWEKLIHLRNRSGSIPKPAMKVALTAYLYSSLRMKITKGSRESLSEALFEVWCKVSGLKTSFWNRLCFESAAKSHFLSCDYEVIERSFIEKGFLMENSKLIQKKPKVENPGRHILRSSLFFMETKTNDLGWVEFDPDGEMGSAIYTDSRSVVSEETQKSFQKYFRELFPWQNQNKAEFVQFSSTPVKSWNQSFCSFR